MKKTITKEVSICDHCQQEQVYLIPCLHCNKEYCYECTTKHGKTYAHSVYMRGSGDGFYCKPCNTTLLNTGGNNLFDAYLEIESLVTELETWNTNFRKRQAQAEKVLETTSRT